MLLFTFTREKKTKDNIVYLFIFLKQKIILFTMEKTNDIEYYIPALIYFILLMAIGNL